MCIDDYEFRHYSAVRPKQCRRFVFINEDEIQKAFLINISQFQQNGEVALCKIIFHLSGKGLPIGNRKFYWPKFNVSVQPGDYCKVPFSALLDKQIIFYSFIKTKRSSILEQTSTPVKITRMEQERTQKPDSADDSFMKTGECPSCIGDQIENLKYDVNEKASPIENNQFCSSNQQQPKSDSQEQYQKRIKQPQRQIGQVIIAVKKWRKLYQSKTLNLTKAAKLIGISKKSLDDYYLVLRIGEILNFDFQSNLQSRMGDLRAYIRTFNHKITGKLTKQVRCFQLVPDFDIDEIMEQENGDFHSSHTEID